MAIKMGEDLVRCSFCNKTQNQVRKMISGPNGAFICDEIGRASCRERV